MKLHLVSSFSLNLNALRTIMNPRNKLHGCIDWSTPYVLSQENVFRERAPLEGWFSKFSMYRNHQEQDDACENADSHSSTLGGRSRVEPRNLHLTSNHVIQVEVAP